MMTKEWQLRVYSKCLIWYVLAPLNWNRGHPSLPDSSDTSHQWDTYRLKSLPKCFKSVQLLLFPLFSLLYIQLKAYRLVLSDFLHNSSFQFSHMLLLCQWQLPQTPPPPTPVTLFYYIRHTWRHIERTGGR